MMNHPWMIPGKRPKSHNMVLMNRSDPTPRDWDHEFSCTPNCDYVGWKRTSQHVPEYVSYCTRAGTMETHTGIIGKMSAITQSPALVPPSAGTSVHVQHMKRYVSLAYH